MEPRVIYTIGHSNRGIEELLELLQSAGVATLVDIRARPRSRRNPQFDQPSLRKTLERTEMVYHWAGRSLGGQRQPRKDSIHPALADDSLRGFADHMDDDTFVIGSEQLIRLADKSVLAVMCAERLPEHCHRQLLADYLLLRGFHVVHLIDAGDRREHLLHPAARRESQRLVYDRYVDAELDLNPG